jgi:hypothetical protein
MKEVFESLLRSSSHSLYHRLARQLSERPRRLRIVGSRNEELERMTAEMVEIHPVELLDEPFRASSAFCPTALIVTLEAQISRRCSVALGKKRRG